VNKLVKVLVVLSVFCAFAAGAFWLRSGPSVAAKARPSAVAEDASPGKSAPIDRVNEKARAARGGDEDAVRELTDAVFNTAVDEDDVIGDATKPLKERVLRAEMEYRKGKRKGVAEIEVVKVINGLAKKYGAPDYAKTDQREVRELRMSMLLTEGDFVARGRNDGKGKPKKKKGDTIGSEMSPLEAVYVTTDMLKQKLYNEDYQLTQEERRARWAEKHDGKKKAGCEGEGCQPKLLDSPRYKEMQEVANRAAGEGASEGLATAHRTLDILGIGR
jgi:hypothetical protein